MVASMNGQHDDLLVRGPKIDRIRKSRQHRAPDLDVDTLKQEWVVDDSGDEGVDGLTKLLPQTDTR